MSPGESPAGATSEMCIAVCASVTCTERAALVCAPPVLATATATGAAARTATAGIRCCGFMACLLGSCDAATLSPRRARVVHRRVVLGSTSRWTRRATRGPYRCAEMARQNVLDGVMAAGFAVGGLVDELTGTEAMTRVHGSAATAVPFLLLVSLPLAVRRRWPLAVLCIVMGAIAADSLVVGKAPQGAEVLFPALIVLYTVGAHTTLPTALAGFAIG